MLFMIYCIIHIIEYLKDKYSIYLLKYMHVTNWSFYVILIHGMCVYTIENPKSYCLMKSMVEIKCIYSNNIWMSHRLLAMNSSRMTSVSWPTDLVLHMLIRINFDIIGISVKIKFYFDRYIMKKDFRN